MVSMAPRLAVTEEGRPGIESWPVVDASEWWGRWLANVSTAEYAGYSAPVAAAEGGVAALVTATSDNISATAATTTSALSAATTAASLAAAAASSGASVEAAANSSAHDNGDSHGFCERASLRAAAAATPRPLTIGIALLSCEGGGRPNGPRGRRRTARVRLERTLRAARAAEHAARRLEEALGGAALDHAHAPGGAHVPGEAPGYEGARRRARVVRGGGGSSVERLIVLPARGRARCGSATQ